MKTNLLLVHKNHILFLQVPSVHANGQDLETSSNIHQSAAHHNLDVPTSTTAGLPVLSDISRNASSLDRNAAARTAVDDHVTGGRANEEPCRSLECLSTLELERSCSKLSALQVKPTGSLAGGWI